MCGLSKMAARTDGGTLLPATASGDHYTGCSASTAVSPLPPASFLGYFQGVLLKLHRVHPWHVAEASEVRTHTRPTSTHALVARRQPESKPGSHISCK